MSGTIGTVLAVGLMSVPFLWALLHLCWHC